MHWRRLAGPAAADEVDPALALLLLHPIEQGEQKVRVSLAHPLLRPPVTQQSANDQITHLNLSTINSELLSEHWISYLRSNSSAAPTPAISSRLGMWSSSVSTGWPGSGGRVE